ncbi:hypothetical protein GCM10007886_01390 [Methylobacterium gregans]|uniref:Uncharacterized protein n=2 Tax=Methylobacterium gregans TaxID=374424 RepID=A0AA37MAL9_9HYPH|nr:hypothetical protein [Methylobacterium gregans]MDQ0521979.1 hypothetical protein [Methylobacterium gregans]GJD77988.1 hypothetical protein NBEOAGPD_1200 [Methylobacterium gregans]GLS51957.1 hypothetical protein GCM10007886_01390 [Methylobacterium gregans]
MQDRPAGPDPPAYPPRYSHRQVVAWIISGLTDKPPLPELGPVPFDMRMRRLVDREIPDREHREQLKAWCRAQMDDGAFRETCRLRGWNRTTAQRHVDLALAHLFLVMIYQDLNERVGNP